MTLTAWERALKVTSQAHKEAGCKNCSFGSGQLLLIKSWKVWKWLLASGVKKLLEWTNFFSPPLKMYKKCMVCLCQKQLFFFFFPSFSDQLHDFRATLKLLSHFLCIFFQGCRRYIVTRFIFMSRVAEALILEVWIYQRKFSWIWPLLDDILGCVGLLSSYNWPHVIFTV